MQGIHIARNPPPPSPPPFYRGGKGILITFPGWDESEKLKKVGGSMVQGQVFLKGGGGLTLFLFKFFKVYHF